MLKDQKSLTTLLRDAKTNRRIGMANLESILPSPLTLDICSHSTGCQAAIKARGPNGVETIWGGSVWYSSCYEFNDKNMALGLQPQFAQIGDTIETFFEEVAKLYAQAKADDAIERAQVKARETRQTDENISSIIAQLIK